MKIFSSEQIKQLDQATIRLEPISPLDLMERASAAFVEIFTKKFPNHFKVKVFCGQGNNGGDGLAIAKFLAQKGYDVTCLLIQKSDTLSENAEINFKRIENKIKLIKITEETLHSIHFAEDDVAIDAIFGTGLSRPIDGLYKSLVDLINEKANKVVSVDTPSGLYADKSNMPTDPIIKSTLTITFQQPKLSFLLQENSRYVPHFEIADIKLHKESIEAITSPYYYLDKATIESIVKVRDKFSHKGSHGHALLIAGSYGMMGAAILATKACVKAGAGKTSAYVPAVGYEIMQMSVPEAMTLTDMERNHISSPPAQMIYDTVGIGPGLGIYSGTHEVLETIFKSDASHFVIDADALNIIANHPYLQEFIMHKSILTPHQKEFDKLFGAHQNQFDRIHTGIAKAAELHIVIIIKGTYSTIITPEGKVYFNNTGNSGLAKGGSGDVLTGILTALLAQKYSLEDAAVLGTYLHGLTADLIIEKQLQSLETLTGSDICDGLHMGFNEITKQKAL